MHAGESDAFQFWGESVGRLLDLTPGPSPDDETAVVRRGGRGVRQCESRLGVEQNFDLPGAALQSFLSPEFASLDEVQNLLVAVVHGRQEIANPVPKGILDDVLHEDGS